MRFVQLLWPAVALVLVFSAGFSAARLRPDAGSPAVDAGATTPAVAALAGEAGLAATQPFPTTATAAPSSASEPAVPLDARAQLARTFLERAGDPAGAVSMIIASMDDRELVSTITALTNLTREDLSQIRDVRDYAQRLANIAMDGVLTDFEAPVEDIPGVMFSNAVDGEGIPAVVSSSFQTQSQDRIYAVFPSEDFQGDQVLVKWFREGDSNLLLFGRYPVRPGEPLNHVWMEREGGWQAGPYVVEFFDPAEPLERLAMGRFVVSDEVPADPSL